MVAFDLKNENGNAKRSSRIPLFILKNALNNLILGCYVFFLYVWMLFLGVVNLTWAVPKKRRLDHVTRKGEFLRLPVAKLKAPPAGR